MAEVRLSPKRYEALKRFGTIVYLANDHWQMTFSIGKGQFLTLRWNH